MTSIKNNVNIESVSQNNGWRKKICRVLLYSQIYLTFSSIVTTDYISSSVTVALWLAVFLVSLFVIKRINKRILLVFLSLVICMSLSTVINNESIIVLIKVLFSFTVAFVFCCSFSFDEFADGFIDVIDFILVCSLIGFFAMQFFPQLKNYFVYYGNNGMYSNYLFFVLPHNYNRNCGIFWEPGAYQIFLNLALLLRLALNKKNTVIKLVCNILAIITTFSTTGYIVLVLIFAYYCIIKTNMSKKSKTMVLSLAALLLLAFFFGKDYLMSLSGNSVFGKIINFFNNDGLASKKTSSISIRINAVILPAKVFLKSPIFGVGYNTLAILTFEGTRGMNTCTMINWFAVYGIVFGFIMVKGYWAFTSLLTNTFFEKFFIFVILFCAIGSENLVNYGFMLLFTIYGFQRKRGN